MTVEELSTLSSDKLKDIGIDSSRPFTLRIRFNEQTYEVQVKAYRNKEGNVILGPDVSSENKDFIGFLKKSPIFKEYYDFLNKNKN